MRAMSTAGYQLAPGGPPLFWGACSRVEGHVLAPPYKRHLSLLQVTEEVAACMLKLLQSCPTPCASRNCCPPGSSVRGILQARTEVGCRALLQVIFPSQGANSHLLRLTCIGRWVLYH